MKNLHVVFSSSGNWQCRISGQAEPIYISDIELDSIIFAVIYSIENAVKIFFHEKNGRIKKVTDLSLIKKQEVELYETF